MVQDTNDTKFGSWKAIANYFERSERTVRRWETTEGMPVHRHKHTSASRIYALKSELDAWFASRHPDEKRPVLKHAKDNPSIAIIPFQFFHEDMDKIFIRDAICEDIISALSQLHSLTVISFSSMRYLGQSEEQVTNTIQSMNLDYYLEGSLRIVDDMLKIQVRLVNASDGQVTWTKSYEGPYSDWSKLHQAIVAELVRHLPFIKDEKLFGSDNTSTMENQAAWEYLHQARFEAFKWQPDAIMRAIQLLQSAEKLVGNNSIILANLGRVHLQKREAGIDFSDAPLKEVEAILETLNTTDPDSFYTQSLTGWYNYATGKMHDAIVHLRKANELQPNDADTLGLLANCYLLIGQPDLALPFIEAVQIVDPLTPIVTCLPGWYSLLEGDFVAAIPPYEKMLAMEPFNPVARMFLAWIYALNNDKEALNTLCEGFPEQQHWMLPAVISFAFREALSDQPVPFELSPEQVSMASANEMFSRFIAFAYAAHGNVEQATQWLEKAFELGFWCYPFLKDYEPFLHTHLNEEPMRSLLEKIRSTWLDK